MITLSVLMLILYQPCVSTDQRVSQPHRSKSVQLGHPVTLECYTDAENVLAWVWFKNTMEHGLRTIVIVSYEIPHFQGQFVNDSHLTVQKSVQSCNLSLSKVSHRDVASYHCAIQWFGVWYFGTGTFLVLSGDSVTLQCTVDSGICSAEHSVYWFRHGSGGSLPGLIYSHGKRSDEAGSPTQSCVYSLPKRNLSHSDAGTYYCAVATCGEILFGNGTVVDIKEDDCDSIFIYLSLMAVIILSLSVNIILIVTLRKARGDRRGPYQTNDVSARFQNDPADCVNYAALSFTSNKSQNRRTQEMQTKVLYAALRPQPTEGCQGPQKKLTQTCSSPSLRICEEH
ncbi:uncharacterized protein LOC108929700 [Arapaima gigas]